MNSNFELFLSKLNSDVKTESLSNINIDYKERIINEKKYIIDNFIFTLLTFKLMYPKPLESIIQSDGKINTDFMIEKYETTLIIEKDINSSNYMTIENLFYTSNYHLEDANNDFKKIDSILSNTKNTEEIFENFILLLNDSK